MRVVCDSVKKQDCWALSIDGVPYFGGGKTRQVIDVIVTAKQRTKEMRSRGELTSR